MTRLLALLLCISLPAFGASYYGGPYVWVEDAETGGYYAPPPGAVGSLDLRGGDPNGNAVFVADSLPPPYILLGASLESTLGDKARAQWGTLFGSEPPAGTLADALWWSVTTGAKEGVGLRPNRDGMLRLTLAGETIREEKFQGELDAYWPKLQERVQADYRKVREASLAEGSKDETLYLRYLADLEAKYAIESDKFIPPDLPKEEAVKPETVYSDDFNRSNETLTTPWTNFANSFAVVSNEARSNSGSSQSSRSRYDGDLSSDDMYTEANYRRESVGNSAFGVLARIESSGTNYYRYECYYNDNGDRLTLRRADAGFTVVATSGVTTWSDGALIRIECDGSQIRGYYDGALLIDYTDASPITGNVRGGLYVFQSSLIYGYADNFEMGDLSAPSPTPPSAHPVNLFKSHIFAGRVVR